MAFFVAALLCSIPALAAPPAAPTFQELMDPAVFSHPQRGLEVESVEDIPGEIRIRTTGADIHFDLASGIITFHQRIGHERPLAEIRLGTPLGGGHISHREPGFARLSFEHPNITIRVNGDSLFMVHAHEALAVPVASRIDTAWHASFENNHLIADEWGAFGLYTSMQECNDQFAPYAPVAATYPLTPDAVLWVGVCPPKPYDWDRSFRDNVVWHWSNTLGYPDDATLARWKQAGNIVLLQSEVMLWKDWNLDFVPRLGADEFARVRETLHSQGMRFIVYTSPYYFLRGTALEPKAFNSFEGFTNWPPGTPTGENMGLFLDAIRRVMTEHKPDGLYFDGQYIENPAALYALARSAREVVGESGILEWHSTWALGPHGCYLPQADAYVDFILRGEGEDKHYEDTDYLRFFVSGYNINNCIGVLCNNGAAKPTQALVERVLGVNARFHTIAGWLDNPEVMGVLGEHYAARLNPAYQQKMETVINERQGGVAAKAAVMREELARLNAPPERETPVFSFTFSTLPAAEAKVSPLNGTPFAIIEDTLEITARASTHAYYSFPCSRPLNSLTVKLRQGSDGGMSWGPGALLHWPDGSVLRIGSRSDGALQYDILGKQYLGKELAPNTWLWLRARWGARFGIIEYSLDGEHYTRAWDFEHKSRFTPAPSELLVGKVPFHGMPEDFSEPGPEGSCRIAFVEIHGSE